MVQKKSGKWRMFTLKPCLRCFTTPLDQLTQESKFQHPPFSFLAPARPPPSPSRSPDHGGPPLERAASATTSAPCPATAPVRRGPGPAPVRSAPCLARAVSAPTRRAWLLLPGAASPSRRPQHARPSCPARAAPPCLARVASPIRRARSPAQRAWLPMPQRARSPPQRARSPPRRARPPPQLSPARRARPHPARRGRPWRAASPRSWLLPARCARPAPCTVMALCHASSRPQRARSRPGARGPLPLPLSRHGVALARVTPACARFVHGASAWPCVRARSRGAHSALARLAMPSAGRVASCRG
jgi:hypothetical protein